jgi:hypothetical protein
MVHNPVGCRAIAYADGCRKYLKFHTFSPLLFILWLSDSFSQRRSGDRLIKQVNLVAGRIALFTKNGFDQAAFNDGVNDR